MIPQTSHVKISGSELKAWGVWVFAALFYLYQFILRTSSGVMVEDLMKTFAVGACEVGIISAFYYNAYSLMQIPLGVLMDRFGPRLMLTISCATVALGCYVFSQSSNIHVAALGRMLTGAGAACGFIGTLKLATLWLPMDRLARATGFTMLLGTLGAYVGGKPFAYFIGEIGWRGTLLMMSIVGISLSIMIYMVVRDGPQDQEGHYITPDHHPISWWKSVKMQLVSSKVWFIAIYGGLLHVPVAVIADLWGVQFLSTHYKIERGISAEMIAWIFVGIAVGAPIVSFLSDAVKSRKKIMAFAAVSSLIIYLPLIYLDGISQGVMFILLFMAGIAFAGQSLVFAAVCEIMPISVSGAALGFTNMTVMLSGVIFEPLVGWILDAFGNPQLVEGIRVYTVGDYRLALSVVPVCLLIAIFLLRYIPETYGKHSTGKS